MLFAFQWFQAIGGAIMLHSQVGTRGSLQSHLEAELAMYRHRVFVERLGWKLPGDADGMERDQFDDEATVYAMIHDADGDVCGCARLLPTTGPYLLCEVFSHLMGGQELPCADEVWELSRFTTESVSDVGLSADDARERFRTLLRAVVEAAVRRGARRLITFSYVGVERIARRFGLHVHRAGRVHQVDGRPVLAFWIELDEQTMAALGLDWASAQAPGPQPALSSVAAF